MNEGRGADPPEGVQTDALLGAGPLFVTAARPGYDRLLAEVISRANAIYRDFVWSDEGRGFAGKVRPSGLLIILFMVFIGVLFYTTLGSGC